MEGQRYIGKKTFVWVETVAVDKWIYYLIRLKKKLVQIARVIPDVNTATFDTSQAIVLFKWPFVRHVHILLSLPHLYIAVDVCEHSCLPSFVVCSSYVWPLVY
jgi:hypothetical protein